MTMMTDTHTGTAPAPGRGNHFLLHFVVALVLLALGGGYVLYEIAQFGKIQFNSSNAGLFWGFPIVVYDYFLLTSTGLVMVASLYFVFGMKAFKPVARRALWLAFAGLIGGVAVLFLELGHPLRAIWAVPLSMQFESPLFWKVLLVAGFAGLLALVLLGMINKSDSGRNPLMVLVALLALAITLVAGSVYGMMAMRPMWFGGEMPVVFLIESFMGALAFIVFFSHLKNGFNHGNMRPETRALFEGELANMHAIAIALHFILHMGRAVSGLWSNAEGMQVWSHVVSGPLFWFSVLGCMVLPFLLVVLPSTRKNGQMQVLAAFLVMVGLLISRYEFIIGGQLVTLFKGSWAPAMLEYTPSTGEWALLVLAVGLANAVYAFAAWKLGAENQA